jgi:hypothetical protein
VRSPPRVRERALRAVSFGHGGISSLCRHCSMEVLPRQQTTATAVFNIIDPVDSDRRK